MTGFGRASRADTDLSVEVEVRSVNSRHLALKTRLPGEWARLEPKLEKAVKKVMERGAVDVFVRVRVEKAAVPVVDPEILATYHDALDDLGGGDAAALLALPGVIRMEESGPAAARTERTIQSVLKDALAEAVQARGAEGERLTRVLRREMKALQKIATSVRRKVPTLVKQHQQGLRKRLTVLLDGTRLADDDPTLLREVAVLADRGDVTEELDRLDSHLSALDDALGSKGAAGRHIDFLLQEVGREVNTVGSKSSDAAVARQVVALKGHVEKMREQAANIE